MSLDLVSLQGKAVTYQGAVITGTSVKSCTPTRDSGPKTVVLDIDWTIYPKGVVQVNLSTGVVNPIDAIRSIHIDNLGVLNSVVVAFGDTGYEVQAQADSTVTACPATNSLVFYVFFEGTIINGKTRISVNNFMASPDTNLNEPVGIPLVIASGTDPKTISTIPSAAGDLKALFSNGMSGSSTPIFNTTVSGILMITELIGYTIGAYSVGQPANVLMELVNTQTGGVIAAWDFFVMDNLENYGRVEVGHYSNMQAALKMPGTTLSLLNVGQVPTTGSFLLDLTYTLSLPNLLP